MGPRRNKRKPFAIEYRWRPEEFAGGLQSFLSTDWMAWRRYATEEARGAALRTLGGKEERDRYPAREWRAAPAEGDM
jgi:hypothetical protein